MSTRAQGDSDRRDRLAKALTEAGLQAVICSTASEVLLLTGYWPIFGASVAVFTAAGEAFVFVPDDERELAQRTTTATLIPYSPEVLDRLTGPVAELREPLRTLLHKLGLANATLGLVLEHGVQPASYVVMTDFRQSLYALVRELLPGATLHACDALLEWQKAAKTDLELDRLRRAIAVAADGFARVPEVLQPGLREAEVAARLQAAFDRSPAAEALERSYGRFFCMSGPNSATAAAAYARTRQRRLAEGDLVMIHANTCGDGMWTDITRTYTVGAPLPRHQKMRAAISAARAAALKAIQPGASGDAVDAATRSVMEAHGFGKPFKHGTGHGVGYAAANANALPRIHPQSADVLETGMTFNVEPAAYFEGYGGMRHCDVVAVTADGARVLTDF